MISVIIPTYNRAGFLEKAIDSVLKQTFEQFELIVVDDGSTDATEKIVRDLSREIVYVRQENRGAAAARNTGINMAQYDLLAFLDSDDCFDRKKLALQGAAMLENPHYLVSHTQEIWYRRGLFLNQKKKHRKESGALFERCLELCAVGMSTIMAKKELFEQVGMFREDLPCCEDYDLWLRTSVRYPFLLIDHPLTIKDGGRPDQLSVQYGVGMDKFRIASIEGLLASAELTHEQQALARSELVRKCRIYGNGCIKHGRIEEGQHYLRMSEEFETAAS